MADRMNFIIFTLLFLVTVLINVDHGSVPAVTKPIQQDLSISKTSLGFLGSCVYIGLTIGSLFAALLMSKPQIKLLLGFMMMLTGASEIIFPLSGDHI